MNPLYLHDGAARAVVLVPLGLWAAAEIWARWRGRSSRTALEPTYFVVIVAVGVGLVLGFRLETVDSTVIAGGWTLVVMGAVITLLGTALRVWAIVELGRFFTVTVTIQEEHRVVDTGPYRLIRHPSYTGLLVALLGVGLALENWLSLASLNVLPLVGILVRIHAEEAALMSALSSAYADYAARTDRLIPGVW